MISSSSTSSPRPPSDALQLLVDLAPGVFRAGWAVVLDGSGVLTASPGSPELPGVKLSWMPLATARRMDTKEEWVPERWDTLGTELVAAPVGSPDRVILIGRPGGPRFRASEVLRLAHLAGIAATVTAAAVPV